MQMGTLILEKIAGIRITSYIVLAIMFIVLLDIWHKLYSEHNCRRAQGAVGFLVVLVVILWLLIWGTGFVLQDF